MVSGARPPCDRVGVAVVLVVVDDRRCGTVVAARAVVALNVGWVVFGAGGTVVAYVEATEFGVVVDRVVADDARAAPCPFDALTAATIATTMTMSSAANASCPATGQLRDRAQNVESERFIPYG